jgi:hypothetical protein
LKESLPPDSSTVILPPRKNFEFYCGASFTEGDGWGYGPGWGFWDGTGGGAGGGGDTRSFGTGPGAGLEAYGWEDGDGVSAKIRSLEHL